jgi:hypothetical protein
MVTKSQWFKIFWVVFEKKLVTFQKKKNHLMDQALISIIDLIIEKN